MLYKQFQADQQRAVWFMDGTSKVNGWHPIWNATTLMEEGKHKSALWPELHALFLALREELNMTKAPIFFLIDLWMMAWPDG